MPSAIPNVTASKVIFSGRPGIKYKVRSPSHDNGGPGITGRKLPTNPATRRTIASTTSKVVSILFI